MTDGISRQKKKITQAISEAIKRSFDFGVLQLSRDKQMRLTESRIYQVSDKCHGEINVNLNVDLLYNYNCLNHTLVPVE